ncbi:MAG: hypothetical protein AB7T37_02465 [Dehalococcoidia bacterium]
MSGTNGSQTSGLKTVLTRLSSPGYVLVVPFVVIAILAFVLDLSLTERLALSGILVALVIAIRSLYQPWWLRKYGRRR